jgi:NitT/TauT family transport system ATP-binding protein
MSIPTDTTSTTAILDVDRVRHVYGAGDTAYTAIHDLSFSIRAGELVSIVGPSGAGKTTLLRILAGLLAPTSGSVSLLGRKVTDVPEGMAMVFQDYSRSLLPWQRVERNVLFPLDRSRSVPSVSRVTRTSTRGSSPGACSSGSRSPARSRRGRASC